MSNFNATANGSQPQSAPKPWEVNKFPVESAVSLPTADEPFTKTVEAMPLNLRNSLRAKIDEVNAKDYEGMVNAPRALPPLNVRNIYEFPVYCLGELIEDAVIGIAAISQCHPDIAAHVCMGYVSLAMQGQVDVVLPWNNTVQPSSLWLATVADSSDRKSSADKLVSPVVRKWEKELMKRYRDALPLYEIQFQDWDAKRAKIMKESTLTSEQKHNDIGPAPAKPAPPILISDNPTYEGLRDIFIDGAKIQGLFSDDGGTFLGGHSMKPEQVLNTIAALSKMWDASPINKLRAGANYRHADQYRLAVHLMFQPVIANRFLNDKLFRGQGLLSRFLTAWPDNESLAGTRYSEDVDPIHYENVQKFNDVLYKLLKEPLPTNPPTQGELQPRQLRFTPEADKLRKDWNDGNQRHLVPGGKYWPIKDFVGKCLEHAARYAATLETFYDYSSYITEKWFSNALEIVDYYIKQQLESAINGNDPAIVKAHKLYHWLNEKSDYPYVTTRYLAQRSPFRSVEEVKPVIKTLEEFGLLQEAGKGQFVDGNMARQAWKVNRGYY
jgi:Protein of unknown function (DUF3987)